MPSQDAAYAEVRETSLLYGVVVNYNLGACHQREGQGAECDERLKVAVEALKELLKIRKRAGQPHVHLVRYLAKVTLQYCAVKSEAGKHTEAFALAQASNKACMEALKIAYQTCKSEATKIESISLLKTNFDDNHSSHVSLISKTLTSSKSLASLAPKRASLASTQPFKDLKTIAIQDFLVDSDQSFEEDADLSKELVHDDVFVVDPLLSRTPKAKQTLSQPGSGKVNHSQILQRSLILKPQPSVSAFTSVEAARVSFRKSSIVSRQTRTLKFNLTQGSDDKSLERIHTFNLKHNSEPFKSPLLSDFYRTEGPQKPRLGKLETAVVHSNATTLK